MSGEPPHEYRLGSNPCDGDSCGGCSRAPFEHCPSCRRCAADPQDADALYALADERDRLIAEAARMRTVVEAAEALRADVGDLPYIPGAPLARLVDALAALREADARAEAEVVFGPWHSCTSEAIHPTCTGCDQSEEPS